jgi:hypothetical protein
MALLRLLQEVFKDMLMALEQRRNFISRQESVSMMKVLFFGYFERLESFILALAYALLSSFFLI